MHERLKEKHHRESGARLAALIEDGHRQTLALIAGLSEEQLLGPRLPTVNPLRWELGHVAHFYATFFLRELGDLRPLPPGRDELYDSFVVDHDDRWDLPLPSMAETLRYKEDVKARLLERLPREPDPAETYLCLLGLYHEDMHDEAFLMTRQTLEYPAPPFAREPPAQPAASGPLPGDCEVPGGSFV